MKIALFVFFVSSLLLSTTAEFVLDTDGEPLKSSGSYYILPAIVALVSRGVGLAKTGNETCPLSVVQVGSDFNYGTPVRFESLLPIRYIFTGLSLKLAFDSVPDCATTPSQWTVVDLDGSKFVKITGYDNPVLGWFEIERAPIGLPCYKLVFYPRSSVTSGNVVPGELSQLVVTGEKDRVFYVVFKKADSSAT